MALRNLFVIFSGLFLPWLCLAQKPVVVGSKVFTESYILAEIIAQSIESQKEVKVDRKFGLGGTGIVYQALRAGEIDIYADYTGTIAEEILRKPELRTSSDLRPALAELGLEISAPLGFNNTYAIATTEAFAQEHKLRKISDLKKVPTARFGISYEFAQRKDGFFAMLKHYGMRNFPVSRMEHNLAYEALRSGKVDLMEIYSTDAKVRKMNLVILQDDENFFPQYYAVFLARKDFVEKYPKSWAALQRIEAGISEARMAELNAEKELQKKPFSEIAAGFLGTASNISLLPDSKRILLRTKEHALLVGISLAVAILLGIPLGILASKYKWFTQSVLLLTGLVQTIPSLALLCFLIPVIGIGKPPAFVALFLYALLPIVRNTCVGLQTIDARLRESARTLGLVGWRLLRLIELPLAFRTVLAGIKTAAVINVGTATLAAFVGAGGYGAPIVTGLALNDVSLILRGAIPAALMALAVHFFFEVLDRVLTPKGLR